MFRDRLVYMGLHFMVKEGKPCFEPIKDKCDAIRNMQPLHTVKECRQFCGMVNFLSTFLPKLRKYLIPIYALTKSTWAHFMQVCCHPTLLKRAGYLNLVDITIVKHCCMMVM